MRSRVWGCVSLAFLLACSRSKPSTSAGEGAALVAPTPAPAAVAPTVRVATPNAHEVRFVALGDTGKGNEGQTLVAQAMHRHCAAHGCDFVLLLGDNIYESGARSVEDPLWQSRFEVPYAALTQPFYALLGNHDYGHRGMGDEFELGAVQIAYSARSSKWRMPASYYQLMAGPVEVLGLDTNALLWGREDGQHAQLRAWMAVRPLPWRIVAGHHPYWSNGPHGNAGAYNGAPASATLLSGARIKQVVEQEVCGKAEIYLSAHDHTREWLDGSCGGTEMVVSGTGSAPTALHGHDPSRFSSVGLGFFYVVASDSELVGSMVNLEGQVEFRRTLHK